MNFGNNILKYRDDIIKDLAKLVSIESVRSEPLEGMPFGKNCAKALSCILDMADTMAALMIMPAVSAYISAVVF